MTTYFSTDIIFLSNEHQIDLKIDQKFFQKIKILTPDNSWNTIYFVLVLTFL